MDRAALEEWLSAYVEAWRSYDREAIRALFSEDVEYRYHPYDEPLRGREAVVESWLDDPDEPSSWEAGYEPVAIDEDVAVATGTSTYSDADGTVRALFHNCFVMRFGDDGRCREFTEWYVEQPDPASPPDA